jgi:hypothetical protein
MKRSKACCKVQATRIFAWQDLLWNGFKRCVGDHVHHINSEESMFGVKSLSYILEDHKKSIQSSKPVLF